MRTALSHIFPYVLLFTFCFYVINNLPTNGSKNQKKRFSETLEYVFCY